MDAFKYLQTAWWDDSEKVWKKQHGWHPCLKGEEVGGKDCLRSEFVVFLNAAASQAHSLCWSNYVGVLGKKAKQLEKGLALGKPKFKKLEEVEQPSSPGGGHASHLCKRLEQLLGQSKDTLGSRSVICGQQAHLSITLLVQLLPAGEVPHPVALHETQISTFPS